MDQQQIQRPICAHCQSEILQLGVYHPDTGINGPEIYIIFCGHCRTTIGVAPPFQIKDFGRKPS